MKYLSDLIEQRIKEYENDFHILVLKGFSNKVFIELSKDFRPINDDFPFDSDGKIDLEVVDKSFVDLLSSLNNNLSGAKRIMLFESFSLLSGNVNVDQLKNKFLIIENDFLNEYPNQSNKKADDFEDAIEEGEEIPEEGLFYKYYSNAIKRNGQLLIQYIDGVLDEFENVVKLSLLTKQCDIDIKTVNAGNLPKRHYLFQPFKKEFNDFKLNLMAGNTDEDLKLVFEKRISFQKDAYDELMKILCFLSQTNYPCEVFQFDERLNQEYRPELNSILEKHWQSSKFRDLKIYGDPDISKNLIDISQAAIVEEVIRQYENGEKGDPIRDLLLTAPTGSGKSLLFQLPAIYLAENYNAVTIVISPLIALMKDQVAALKEDRNYFGVAYINSELSLIEREEVIRQVQEGEISMLYMSPELLLSYHISMFLGERKLGLLVVDEAHLVTTWGRDFRVDYWYLGTFIRKIRKYSDYKFPAMAVTATAVYNGPNDMVFETLDSLSLENAMIYIGKVRREEISFHLLETSIDSSHEKEKVELTAKRVQELIDREEKTIVYCPWTNQLQIIRDSLEGNYRSQTGLYYGGLDKEIKNETYEQFKDNQIKTIIATKAFGMGVDIDDITAVYHHAPSGHLADYVQEIGRLARRSDLTGNAMIDFHIKDLKFTRILYGLSSIKQYQVQFVLEKLLKIYDIKKRRNLVVSVEDFQHIFNFENVDVEQKVKSSLLLLEKDLLYKYRYNVLIARPKSLFTTVFARIKAEHREQFEKKYGDVSRHIYHAKIEMKGQIVYTIELDKIWERYHSDRSFPLVKKEYFDKELFEPEDLWVSPQWRINFYLNQSPKETFNLLTKRFEIVERQIALFTGGFFRKQQLEKRLEEEFGNRLLAKRIADLFLAIYASPVELNGKKMSFIKRECFIQQRRVDHEYQYRVISKAYPKVKASVRKRFNRLFGDLSAKEREQTIFIPVYEKKNIGIIQMAYVLEAFNLASYEIGGGEKPGVFIRLNDPVKLKRLFDKGYTNAILQEIERRQKTSVQIMEYFFTHSLSDEQRWDFIESYFLGSPVEELISGVEEEEFEEL